MVSSLDWFCWENLNRLFRGFSYDIQSNGKFIILSSFVYHLIQLYTLLYSFVEIDHLFKLNKVLELELTEEQLD